MSDFFKKPINEDYYKNLSNYNKIPHREIIDIESRYKEEAFEYIKQNKELLDSISSAQFRRFYNFCLDCNYNFEEIKKFILHQIDREQNKDFYNNIKDNFEIKLKRFKEIEKYRESKIYLKTILSEILLYKKMIETHKEYKERGGNNE